MRKAVCAGLIAGSIVLTTGAAASAAAAQIAGPQIAAGLTTGKDSQAARPFSAILRYGPGTTSICRSLSDNSSAICLLLALHVIQLSQKPVSETKL